MPTVQCSCGHVWTPRKPLEEIETLRCSSCGTTSQEDLSVSEDTEKHTHDSSIVTEVEAKATREDLLERVQDLIYRVVGTAPSESNHEVAEEMRGEFNRLHRLATVLEDDDKSISPDELQATTEFIDDLESSIDEHADQLDRLDDLQSTVTELESEVSELRSERDALNAELGELQDEYEELSHSRDKLEKRVGLLREDASAYQQGYERGMEHFEIEIPCAQCGDPMRMNPDSQMHRSAIDLLQQDGWSHSRCFSDAKSRPGQRSW